MSEQVIIQVAETRLAISCDHPSFLRWIQEIFGGFIGQGEPHLKCNLHFVHNSPEGGSDRSLSVTPLGTISEGGELEFQVTTSVPTEYFWLILQICIRYAFGAKRPLDLLLHSSGIVHEGRSYIFTGVSGAGKSTVCKLLAPDPSFTILHDEVVAVSFNGNNVHAWSTPLRGEIGNRFNIGAHLRAIFFLKQDLTNYAVKIERKKAAELLCYSLIAPKVLAAGRLVERQARSFNQVLALAELIPTYELHFRPEPSFWDCLPTLFEDESESPEKEKVNVQ